LDGRGVEGDAQEAFLGEWEAAVEEGLAELEEPFCGGPAVGGVCPVGVGEGGGLDAEDGEKEAAGAVDDLAAVLGPDDVVAEAAADGGELDSVVPGD
jgi:hypothetical protein